MDLNQIAIKGTTQEHLPIEDIKEDLAILKDGSCLMVLKTSSVNFDLLSEREQEATIYAYAAILNSLTFPIQLIIRSSLKDISSYLDRLKQQETKPLDPLLREQIVSYRKFIEEVVKKNNVLTKSFYLIIPFYSIELGIGSATKTSFPILPMLLSFLNKKQAVSRLPMPKEKIIERALASLEPKREHLIRLFARIGLSVSQMVTKELIQLFYQIYNQESILVGNTEALVQQGAIIKAARKTNFSPEENTVSTLEDLEQSGQAKIQPLSEKQKEISQPENNDQKPI